MGRLTARGAFICLVVLAALSWAIVVLEVAFLGRISVFTVANAAAFTLTVALWPILSAGTSAKGKGIVPPSCTECGALLHVAAIRFCLRCGAYPKVRARAA